MREERKLFVETLKKEYEDLFANDPEYSYAKQITTPTKLAEKMTTSLAMGNGNKDGTGIKRTCKKLNIPYTYKGISTYLIGR